LPLSCNFAGIPVKQNNPAPPARGAGFDFAEGKILFTDSRFHFLLKFNIDSARQEQAHEE
jgi:hypothetical protein